MGNEADIVRNKWENEADIISNINYQDMKLTSLETDLEMKLKLLNRWEYEADIVETYKKKKLVLYKQMENEADIVETDQISWYCRNICEHEAEKLEPGGK